MAFDSPELLIDWQENGRWPAIHDEMANLVAQTYTTTRKESILDICSSIGILGQRIHEETERMVIGSEWSMRTIELGREHGITVPTIQSRVMPGNDSLNQLIKWMTDYHVTGIVGRRCLCYVFGGPDGNPWPAPDWEWAARFLDAVVAAGVREIWTQGLIGSKRSTHPLPDTAAELAALATHFTVAERTANCAYLVARPAPIEITDTTRQSIIEGTIEP